MPDRRDDVDDWLSRRIEPLAPPPGTFELIKRRARRRKFRKLAITASAAAAVVAAAVTVPQVVNLPVLSPNPTSSVAAGQSAAATPTVKHSPGGSSAAASSAAPILAPVPGNFRPTSVTFIGTRTGWVIGQALSPGHCATQFCTSVARTNDAGGTWAGVPAPLTGGPDGATGVSKIRFLDTEDGWAFGPQLFVTHTGGRTWAPVDTDGQRVTQLETVGTRVFAVFASCSGTGTAYATGCTSFTLYSSPAAAQDWAPVGTATTGLTDGAASEAASLVLTGGRGYLLGPDGTLYAGPVDGDAAWQRVTQLETVGTRVFAVLASCSGTGTAYATGCTSFTLYSSPAAAEDWAPVGTATTGLTDGAASEAASLVLTGGRGYLLGPDGTLYAGPVDGNVAWPRVSSLISPCTVGSAQADGQPTGALLGAVNARDLIVACASDSRGGNPGVSSQRKLIFSSPNGGISWIQMAKAPRAGVAYWLAAGPSGTVVLGTDQGIDVLPAGEIAWQVSSLTGNAPAGGFGYVGMTTDTQGIALPANPASGAVWFTFDGGKSWKPSPLTGS